MEYALQIFVLLILLVLSFGCMVYAISITWSLLRGAPYVSSSMHEVRAILREVALEKDMRFLELGCGDGRVTCEAVATYGVIGRGVDISPLWVFGARIRARFMGISNRAEFQVADILKTDLASFDVIYLYMMPRFIARHAEILFARCRPGTLIISHVFDIPALQAQAIEAHQPRYYLYRISTP